ncbi:MAG TPA: Sip1-related alpha-galactosidase, partial [Sphaerochaeta sp.]|nr:Sip1-related alpha-galactosidase [Sphaerochaeta sp.]
CMGMAPENLWGRTMWAISRNSDDYVPQDTDGFAEHALQNAFNSAYHSYFQQGDWDMFWTDHPQSTEHALLRVIGGGPLYISDPVGKTNALALLPVVLSDGRVATCDGTARVAPDSLFRDPVATDSLLKVTNTYGEATMVACFNITASKQSVQGDISSADVRNPIVDAEYVIFDVLNQKLHEGKPLSVTLAAGEVAMYQIVPKKRITALGLLSKYVPLRGIAWQERRADTLLYKLTDSGKYGFYSETQPTIRLIGGNSEQLILHFPESWPGVWSVECDAAALLEVSLAEPKDV